MFILDDMGKAPFKGFMFIVREVANAAQQEIAKERATVMADLSRLHLQLENGEINEDEFDDREQELLDRLEEIEEL